MLLLDNVVEELTSLTMLKNQEADLLPLPDLVKFNYIRMVLRKKIRVRREYLPMLLRS